MLFLGLRSSPSDELTRAASRPPLHSCGIASNGTAFCWGFNGYGNLGTGTVVDSPGLAMRVAPKVAYNFTQISSGNQHTCGILADGSIVCWGSNSHGQMAGNLTVGDDIYYTLPRPWWPGQKFTKVACGHSNTYAIQ